MGGVFLLLSKISFYGTTLILIILILVLSLKFNKKAEEKINEEVSNEYIASYFDGEYQNEIPGKDDGYVVEKIVCDNGAIATWDNEEWGINIRNATEKIKCSIYFKFQFEQDFDYTGTEQVLTIPKTGTYKIELWGASGGGITVNDTFYNGGLGGYVSGIISLEEQQKLYIYVGGSTSTYEGGYNGGSTGGTTNDGTYTGGGGSTDIRLVNGEWNVFSSLKSRIMVASGGAGTGIYIGNIILGGSAGGVSGYSGNITSCNVNNIHNVATGATNNGPGVGQNGTGTFGYSIRSNGVYGTGGGSGYYGGGTGGSTPCNVSSGAGGSSFISGHNGCDAIKEESTEDNIIHTGQSKHYSGMYFTDTVIIDGEGYKWATEKGSYTGMPTHDGSSNMKGNTGNGYAKITYVG